VIKINRLARTICGHKTKTTKRVVSIHQIAGATAPAPISLDVCRQNGWDILCAHS